MFGLIDPPYDTVEQNIFKNMLNEMKVIIGLFGLVRTQNIALC